ncbi:MAG: ABC transporter ATP-binding protein [Spirochaetaceae bacterium]|nr:ABC transporter ATP-binding protein [Spirochaetaceae bacterium]
MNVLGYLWTFVRARPGVLVLSLALWLAQSLAELAPGLIVRRFFDALQQQAFAAATQSVLLLLVFAAGFAGIVMATAVASARLRFHVANALRRGILAALLNRPPGAAQPSVGAALATARDDPPTLAGVVATAVDQLSIVMFAVVALTVMARIDPLITAVAVAPVAVVLAVSQLTRRRVHLLRAGAREAAADATGFIVNALAAWQTIQLGGASEAAAGRLTRLDAERGRRAIRDQLLDRSIRAAFAATSTIGSGLVLAVAAGAMRSGDFSVGDFALFAYYLTFLGEFSAEFGGLLLQYRQARVSWRRIGALSGVAGRRHWHDAARPSPGVEPDPVSRTGEDGPTYHSRDRGSASTAGRGGPEPLRVLQLKDLRVRNGAAGAGTVPHPPASPAGDAIDLTLRAGELVAVTGRVGAGKTTLLKALVGLTPLDGGAILWNGAAVRDPVTWFRHPVCTYVPQEPHLFSVSIHENVALEAGLDTDERAEAVDAALQAAALTRDVATLPHGPATVVGTAGSKLSGGQRQRLASARAFFRGAPLIVLDDPCSALDPATEQEYLRQVRHLAQGGALCVVSGTGKALLQAADRIVVLRDGTVAATGTLPELLTVEGELSLIWNSQDGAK